MNQCAVAHRLGLTDGSGLSRAIAELNRNLARSRRRQRLYRKAEIRIAKDPSRFNSTTDEEMRSEGVLL